MTIPFHSPGAEKPLLELLACAMFAFLASSPWSQGVSIFGKTGIRRTIQRQLKRLFFFFPLPYQAPWYSLHQDRNDLWWATLAALMENSRVVIFVLGNLRIFSLLSIYPDKQNAPCFIFKLHFTQTFCRWISCTHNSVLFFFILLYCLYLLNGVLHQEAFSIWFQLQQ